MGCEGSVLLGCLMDDEFCTRYCEGGLVKSEVDEEAGIGRYFGLPARGVNQVDCDFALFG